MTHYSFPDHRVGEVLPPPRSGIESLFVHEDTSPSRNDPMRTGAFLAPGNYWRPVGRRAPWCGPMSYWDLQAVLAAARRPN